MSQLWQHAAVIAAVAVLLIVGSAMVWAVSPRARHPIEIPKLENTTALAALNCRCQPGAARQCVTHGRCIVPIDSGCADTTTYKTYVDDDMYGYVSSRACEGCLTVEGERCVFPFVYNDKIYTSCATTADRPTQWCATGSNAETNWGVCGKGCAST